MLSQAPLLKDKPRGIVMLARCGAFMGSVGRGAGPQLGADWTEIALVNPGFETGDFTGWTPYEANTPGNGEIKSATPFTARTGSYFAWLDLAGQSLEQILNLDSHLPSAALADGVALDFKAECYAKTTASPDRLRFSMAYKNVNSNFVTFSTQDQITEISSSEWTLVESGTFSAWPSEAALRGTNELRLLVSDNSSGSLVRMGYDDFKLWWRYAP